MEEELYYPSSENKGADQLRGYREADLRLCFRLGKIRFSHDAAHLILLASWSSDEYPIKQFIVWQIVCVSYCLFTMK